MIWHSYWKAFAKLFIAIQEVLSTVVVSIFFAFICSRQTARTGLYRRLPAPLVHFAQQMSPVSVIHVYTAHIWLVVVVCSANLNKFFFKPSPASGRPSKRRRQPQEALVSSSSADRPVQQLDMVQSKSSKRSKVVDHDWLSTKNARKLLKRSHDQKPRYSFQFFLLNFSERFLLFMLQSWYIHTFTALFSS